MDIVCGCAPSDFVEGRSGSPVGEVVEVGPFVTERAGERSSRDDCQTAPTWDQKRFDEALDGLDGKHSLPFLIDVAEATMNDDEVCDTSEFNASYVSGDRHRLRRRHRQPSADDDVLQPSSSTPSFGPPSSGTAYECDERSG